MRPGMALVRGAPVPPGRLRRIFGQYVARFVKIAECNDGFQITAGNSRAQIGHVPFLGGHANERGLRDDD